MNNKKRFCKDIWFWLGLLLVILGAQKIVNFASNPWLFTLLAVLQVIIGGGLLIRTVNNAV